MTASRPITILDTHEVTNQPPPREGGNLFEDDRAFVEAVRRAGGVRHTQRLPRIGRRAASAEVLAWGEAANRHAPVLERFDAYGRWVDEVEFHPAYQQLMALGIENGVAAAAWEGRPESWACAFQVPGTALTH